MRKIYKTTKKIKTCANCFIEYEGRRNQKYCSSYCRWKAWDKRNPRIKLQEENHGQDRINHSRMLSDVCFISFKPMGNQNLSYEVTIMKCKHGITQEYCWLCKGNKSVDEPMEGHTLRNVLDAWAHEERVYYHRWENPRVTYGAVIYRVNIDE